MDLHPDAEIAAGMLSQRGLAARTLSWLNDRAYRNADTVIDLGPYMRRRIFTKGVEPDRLHTVPVWGPEPEPPAAPTAVALREHWGLRGKCV